MEPLLQPMTQREVEDWFERFEFMTLTRKDCKDIKVKTAHFLTCLGKTSYALIKDLTYPELLADKNYYELKELLLDHVTPANFEATERAKFHSLNRRSDQPIRDFILQLQTQAAKCNFKGDLEEQLRDRLIAGIGDETLQRKLLLQTSLTFLQAKTICTQQEDVISATTDSLQCLRLSQSSNAARKGQKDYRAKEKKTTSLQHNFSACHSCGGRHLRKFCKFRDSICHFCSRKGHIKSACMSKQKFRLASNSNTHNTKSRDLTSRSHKVSILILRGHRLVMRKFVICPLMRTRSV